MSNRPEGFNHVVEPNGDITITHHGRKATTLRGTKAQQFLAELESADPQELMARRGAAAQSSRMSVHSQSKG